MIYSQCGPRAKDIYIRGTQKGGKPHTLSSIRKTLGEEGYSVSVKSLSQWAADDQWEERRRAWLERVRRIDDINAGIEGIEQEILKGLLPARDRLQREIDETPAGRPLDPEKLKLLKDLNAQVVAMVGAIRAARPPEKAKPAEKKGLSKKMEEEIKEKFLGIRK